MHAFVPDCWGLHQESTAVNSAIQPQLQLVQAQLPALACQKAVAANKRFYLLFYLCRKEVRNLGMSQRHLQYTIP